MSTLQVRRWRGTFLLAVVDHDNDRFTIEGPMTDDQPWVAEILRAQRAGRRITCTALSGPLDEAVREWEWTQGGTRWPSGSILSPVSALVAGRQELIPSAAAPTETPFEVEPGFAAAPSGGSAWRRYRSKSRPSAIGALAGSDD